MTRTYGADDDVLCPIKRQMFRKLRFQMIDDRLRLKRLVSFALLLLCVIPISLIAKPKKKAYNNTPQEVFQAALRTARERHVVTYVDEKNLMITFETGTSGFSYGFVANASIEPETDGKATLVINVQKKKNSGNNATISFGAGDRMADKFYEQVEEELARNSSQKAAVKPAGEHVDVPPTPMLNNTADVPSGTVTILSTPEGADISVDGSFVGNAPAALKLSPGKHNIGVTQNGYKSWNRELSVISGSEVKLNAALEKQ